MKKASNILYIVGLVLLAVGIIESLVGGVVTLLLARPMFDNVINIIKEYGVDVPEIDFNLFLISFISGWVSSLVFSGAAMTISAIAYYKYVKEEPSNTPHIMMIVAGALGGGGILIAGGVLGLIAHKKESSNVTVVPNP